MAQAERDRLRNFSFSCEEGEDIELSLGLSLNGRFGVDPRAKKLCRSSSIPEFVSQNGAGFAVPLNSDLMRTCSLPAETDEQWRQKKEIQMLRRMEAKRKRSEKQRNFKKENGNQNSNGLFGADAQGFSPNSTVTAPSSQHSIGSQGSGSSATLESGINPVQGTNKHNSEARSPVSVQSLSECEQKFELPPKSQSPPAPRAQNSIPIKPKVTNGEKEPPMKNILGGDMPCVSTKGDGPNGRRIEGFLYRYKKGEEVRIVCVCHGSFLTPAEFVKHAGGGDVAHPLRHIVVNPFPVL